MDIVLTPVEVRVLGSLVEKELTTPEYYPLTLNSLVAACNQKSNRDPVMSLSDDDVAMALESLRGKNLAWQLSTAGGRVPKFEHNLPARLSIAAQDKADAALSDENSQPPDGNAAGSRSVASKLMRKELSVLTSLMLRGPLTAGELRGVTARMFPFSSIDEVEECMAKLASPQFGPLVEKLPRQPGMKEQRFMHCFFGDAPAQAVNSPATAATAPLAVAGSVNERFAILEQKVNMLADEIAALKQAFGEVRKLVE
jgi:hypothetical protein